MRKPVIFFCLLFFAISFLSYSQSGFVSMGNNFKNGNGEISYSVGQIAYLTTFNDAGTLSMGVQQALSVIDITNTDIFVNSTKLNVYPNPAYDCVTLELLEDGFDGIEYSLSDLNGKVLLSEMILCKQTTIPIFNLSNGVYLLTLKRDNNSSRSFKIIKN
ncbi:MAG: T9SS type A sorting domain-containing protein [Bacteroidales bacterium]|nr:T9SS type A sorting domain-containing protein [Bacteroidales bacterium]